jgi:hypothetical protein
MRIKVLLIVGLALWGWSGVHAFAQEVTVLGGVDKGYINFVIETLDEEDRSCGLSQSAMDAAVRVPLSRSGFRIDSNSTDYVTVNFLTTQLPNAVCVAHVQFRFRRMALFKGNIFLYGVEVWNRNSLITGFPSEFGRRVNDLLEGFTNELVAKWLIDNPQ